jgi:hypothetical protein
MHVIGTLLFGSAHVRTFDPICTDSLASLNQSSTTTKPPGYEGEKTPSAASVYSYASPSDPVLARLSTDRLVHSHELLEVFPLQHNIHSISASNNEPCGLLDVIAPPYLPGERECIFYEARKLSKWQARAYLKTASSCTNDDGDRYVLFPIAPDYECYTQRYTGIVPNYLE